MLIKSLLTFSFILISTLVFLFIIWKKLKDDYPQSAIFSTGFYMLLGIAIATILANNFFPSWWFWASFAGGTTGMVTGIFRFKLRIFEVIEASVLGGMVLLGLFFLYLSLENGQLSSALGFLLSGLLIVLFIVLDKHYKGFSWYKSGKVGFSGLTVFGIFFLIRAFVALTFPDVVSLVGRNDAMLSGLLAFLASLAVFNLARQT